MKGTQSQDVLSHKGVDSLLGPDQCPQAILGVSLPCFFASFFSNVSQSPRSFENNQHISLGFSDASASPRNWNDALCTRSFHCDHF